MYKHIYKFNASNSSKLLMQQAVQFSDLVLPLNLKNLPLIIKKKKFKNSRRIVLNFYKKRGINS